MRKSPLVTTCAPGLITFYSLKRTIETLSPDQYMLNSKLRIFFTLFKFLMSVAVTLMYLHPSVDPSLTPFFGEFPGLGLALVPDVAAPRRSRGAHEAEISFQISALAGVEPRNLQSDGHEHYH